MPKPKYRGPVDVDHMKKLTAFSFTRAMAERPRSIVSELSPLATRAPPTRRGSAISDEYRKRKETVRHSLAVTGEAHRIIHPARQDAVSGPLWQLPKLTFLDLEPEVESEFKFNTTSPTADDMNSSTLTFLTEDASVEQREELYDGGAVTPETLSISGSYTFFALDDLTHALNAIHA